jgi:uncharacterized protein
VLGVIVIEFGKVSEFFVSERTPEGFYLSHTDSGEEVFLAHKMNSEDLELNQNIKAFVYLDTSGDRIATTKIPCAVVGEYALMTAVEVQEFGAFFDWGIDKDLLVPGNQQKFSVKEDESYLVRVCLEAETNRVYGTTKLGKYIEDSEFDIEEGGKVKITPVTATDLGYKVIINKKFIGIIYANEIFSNISIGATYDGVVKKIRVDGLVDAALQVQGIKNLVEAKDKIVSYLESCEGHSPLNDKSSPTLIKQNLGMSKQTFKNALGMLYKERKIKLSKDGIELITA